MRSDFYFIAEAGVNHNGSKKLAFDLIDIAKNAGANAVKFQMFRSEELVKSDTKVPEYAMSEKNMSMLELLQSLEFDDQIWQEIIAYCSEKQIDFICTPFDSGSAQLLSNLNVTTFKFSSGDLENIKLIEEVLNFESQPSIILSTGMSTMDTVQRVLDRLTQYKDRIAILHCVSSYPVSSSEANLGAIKSMAEHFHVNVGYSDHTQGVWAPAVAVSLGAKIIEKHFTYDKQAEGPDHSMSLSPLELKHCVKLCCETIALIGDGEKKIQPCEEELFTLARRGAYWSCDVKAGQYFNKSMVDMKRPFNGLTYLDLEEYFGRSICPDAEQNSAITFEHLK